MHGMVHDLVKYLPGVLNRCEKEPCVPFFYDRFLLLVQEGYIDYLDCFVSFLLVPPAMYFRLFFFLCIGHTFGDSTDLVTKH